MSQRDRQKKNPNGPLATRGDRGWIILIILALVFIVIIARLGYLQIFKAGEYAQDAATAHTSDITLTARRGTIYDRNGEAIASDVDATTIYADPTMVKNPTAIAKILEEYLGKTYDKTYDDYLALVTKQNTSFVYIQRKADADTATKMKEALNAAKLVGIYYLDDVKRVYPNGKVGSQVIGTVDPDGNGTSGLELYYDKILKGTDGKESLISGKGGIPIANGVISKTAAVDGEGITTSLDIKLQQRAESTLKKALKKHDAKGGTVTVMDAASGEIYAACSLTLDSKTKTYTYDVGKLSNVSDAYEPGSTFKTITAAAVLERSSVTAATEFTVPGSLKVYDSTIKDAEEHGTEQMSLEEIIAQSSNIGMVLASRKVKPSDLYDYYSAFGFGASPGVDFPGVASGTLAKSSDWNGVQTADIAFGQGVTVTPLQLIRAYCAIEQEGVEPVAHFLTAVDNDKDKTKEATSSFSATKKVIEKKTAASITDMLKSVVKKGTGKAAAVDGFTVAGKTGTAQKVASNGKYSRSEHILSFCGWLAGSSSDLVCLVTMDNPEGAEDSGGPACGPVFADIMSFAAQRYQVAPNTD